MADGIKQVLEGGLGYFWPWTRDDGPPELADELARPGFIRKRDGGLEVHLLVEDASTARPFGERHNPTALLGGTEHAGVLVLDFAGRPGAQLSFGGGKASVERLVARTLVVSPEVFDATRPMLTEASMYLYGGHLLRWTGLHPAKQRVETHPGTHLVRSATIELGPVDGSTHALGSAELLFEPHWRVDSRDELGTHVELALEVAVRLKRPRPSVELLEMLSTIQVMLSAIHWGFVRAGSGRARLPGVDERGFLWNSVLMPEPAPPRVPRLGRNPLALVSFEDLGGGVAAARWVRLAQRHPRAMAPIHNRWRRGMGAREQNLIDVAVALEYWVAVHRRTTEWARADSLKPWVAAKRVGAHFETFVGDSRQWADRFWKTYNDLKHDPGKQFDPDEIELLAETAYVLLLCLMLDRVALTKAPSRSICSSYRLDALGTALRAKLGT